ncbi:ROK family protein [Croceicoccus gelatinilyticus]|uniref:ROK family protein n=1 Tax=Croceicoccus gelatinilyticus TaxID=2835536 RepID=UPI001BCF3522|nr:ROK family protein [Croceicoccus gelatinilyticus]MBS7670847.1 ROK family protein [Croceicoccus gelatinilyticus]
MDSETPVAGIELGGTKAIAVRGRGMTVTEMRSFPTTTPDETLGAVLDVLAEWNAQEALAAIGIASFGPIRVARDAADFGSILATPKAGWANTPIHAPVAARFDCPIGFDTDVNAAALAEHAIGAAQGCSNTIYITIGTGLGAGILLDGVPVHGLLHPEAGHVRTRRAVGDGFEGVCPFHGDCAEGLLSGPALLARLPKHPGELEPDDPAWGPVGRDLAELLAQLILTFSPQRIVIGGGVTNRQPHLLDKARSHIPEILAGYLTDIDAVRLADMIRPPKLGDEAGPAGALALALAAVAENR